MEMNIRYAVSVLTGILDDCITNRDIHVLPGAKAAFQERIDAIQLILKEIKYGNIEPRNEI